MYTSRSCAHIKIPGLPALYTHQFPRPADPTHSPTTDLEVAAYPLLDGLAKGVTPENLDQVRRNKNKLVRLTTRVQTVSSKERGKAHHLCINSEFEREREGLPLAYKL